MVYFFSLLLVTRHISDIYKYIYIANGEIRLGRKARQLTESTESTTRLEGIKTKGGLRRPSRRRTAGFGVYHVRMSALKTVLLHTK